MCPQGLRTGGNSTAEANYKSMQDGGGSRESLFKDREQFQGQETSL